MFAVDVKMDEIFVDFFKEIDCKKIAHRLALNQKLLISWFVSEISEVQGDKYPTIILQWLDTGSIVELSLWLLQLTFILQN